jgi:hypothetical protein
MRVAVQLHAPTALRRQRDAVPIVQECGWPVLKRAENLAPTGIRSPDRLGRKESLYRLSYPGPSYIQYSADYIFWMM